MSRQKSDTIKKEIYIPRVTEEYLMTQSKTLGITFAELTRRILGDYVEKKIAKSQKQS